MTGTPKAQPKVVLDKPGIEPATPGLQGIALIHYTTGAFPSVVTSTGPAWFMVCVCIL